MNANTQPPVLEVTDIAMRFGEVKALDGVSLRIFPGECIGLVGHNGAGKSTIVSVINGGLTPQTGSISGDGAVLASYGIGIARHRGVRCVFQELSLCPNLSVLENARVMHRGLGGIGWRGRARRVIAASLDQVFPDHSIDIAAQVGSLSIAERQMVEIAMAFSDAGAAPRLVILDEPTSSLDAGLSAQLLAHVGRFVAAGGAVILISHILHEVLTTASRIVVMKDGRIIAERPAAGFTQGSLVEAMGSVADATAQRRTVTDTAETALSLPMPRGLAFAARRGEVVGLAGLGGHGQTRMLLALFDTQSPGWLPPRDPLVAFVAGDRRENGTFDLWSILRNMTVAALPDLARRGVADRTPRPATGRAIGRGPAAAGFPPSCGTCKGRREDRRFGDLIAHQFLHDHAFAKDINPVAQAHLGHLGRVPDEGAALFGLGADDAVNLLFRADIDAAHRVIHQHHRGAGG